MDKSIIINEVRQEVYERDGYQCAFKDCNIMGWENLQLAHRVSKGRVNYIRNFWRDKFGIDISKTQAMAILNHPLNLVTSCSKHNSYFLIDNKPVESDKLLEKIHEAQ